MTLVETSAPSLSNTKLIYSKIISGWIRTLRFLLTGSEFCHVGRFRGMVPNRLFIFSKAEKFKITKFGPSTINTLPTNLTCLSQTEEYWPSLPRHRANNSQCGPRARSERSYCSVLNNIISSFQEQNAKLLIVYFWHSLGIIFTIRVFGEIWGRQWSCKKVTMICTLCVWVLLCNHKNYLNYIVGLQGQRVSLVQSIPNIHYNTKIVVFFGCDFTSLCSLNQLIVQ